MSALLFGSISTVADTSELQRESFNQAFAQHGLDWEWSRDDYVAMLGSNGGQGRVASYAASRGEDVDAAAVHATKSAIFQQRVTQTPLVPREGVVETIAAARAAGYRVGLVTTTSPENVAALTTALRPHLDLDSLDVVVDSSKVAEPKPDPAAYAWALAQLGETADHCIAIEDNQGGVASAAAAGVPCIAFPNQNTAGFAFDLAAGRVEALDLDDITGLAAA